MEKNNSGELLSIVVPVYNTEKWLERCLDSLLSQSYRNVEVICVNDASPDGCKEILSAYAARDPRIKIVEHEKNRGLFAARLSGVAAARGKWLAFADSDDYVSCDFYRPLVHRAEEEKADFVLGNIVETDENGWRHYSNIPRRLPRAVPSLHGAEVYKTFLSQRGALFYWHVMWNKVYDLAFFRKCLPHYAPLGEHLVMTEDIAFSCVLYSYAQNVQLADCDCYFYCRHKEASTGSEQSPQKTLKNLKDVVRVFSFFRDVLKERGIYSQTQEDFAAFRKKYFRIWCNNLSAAGLLKDKQALHILLRGFEEEEPQFCTQYEFHLNSLNTEWDDRYEQLKEQICDKNHTVISFDIFDTLLRRPLWAPQDAFYFVQQEASAFFGGAEENAFVKMRLFAEQRCRELNRVYNPSAEDVTLAEIYRTMAQQYFLSEEDTAALKRTEEETEKKLIAPRGSGKELFSLARALGKKVVLVSDMYLPAQCVEEMLQKCGIAGYDALFVSCEYRKLKYTGNLFRVVLDKLGVAPQEVLHIGDTWQNDVVVPRSLGMHAAFLPKAVDVFTGNVHDIFNGNCTSFLNENLSDEFDTRTFAGQLCVRTMYAAIAHELFDNPFVPFQAQSRFNGDPWVMGYFAMGPYLFGVAKWILDISAERGYEMIAFLARDGFLVQKIFEEMCRATGAEIASQYVYATRKCVLPYVMDRPEKFYTSDNFVNIFSPDQTFKKFLQLFADVCVPLTSQLEKEYASHGIFLDEHIGDENRFRNFIGVFLKISFDAAKAGQAREAVSEYYRQIFAGRCAAFDAGYSGRIQKALSDLCSHPVDALFLHDNGESTGRMARAGGFRVSCFYPYSPVVTDILRETFLSDTSPSCIGFERTKEGVRPLFGEEKEDAPRNFALHMMQRGALCFAHDLIQTFSHSLKMFDLRNVESGYLFEYFCKTATEFDRYVFIDHTIEDGVYSGFDGLSLVYRWQENLQAIGAGKSGTQESVPPVLPARQKTVEEALRGCSRWKRALYYWLFDRKTFHEKMKKRRQEKRSRT